jgi:hypothetical protein
MVQTKKDPGKAGVQVWEELCRLNFSRADKGLAGAPHSQSEIGQVAVAHRSARARHQDSIQGGEQAAEQGGGW